VIGASSLRGCLHSCGFFLVHGAPEHRGASASQHHTVLRACGAFDVLKGPQPDRICLEAARHFVRRRLGARDMCEVNTAWRALSQARAVVSACYPHHARGCQFLAANLPHGPMSAESETRAFCNLQAPHALIRSHVCLELVSPASFCSCIHRKRPARLPHPNSFTHTHECRCIACKQQRTASRASAP